MGWVGKRHKSLALNGLGSDASAVGPKLYPLPPGWHGRNHLGLVWAAPCPEIIPLKTAKNRVPVGQKRRRVHFLHGAGWTSAEGATIARHPARSADTEQ